MVEMNTKQNKQNKQTPGAGSQGAKLPVNRRDAQEATSLPKSLLQLPPQRPAGWGHPGKGLTSAGKRVGLQHRGNPFGRALSGTRAEAAFSGVLAGTLGTSLCSPPPPQPAS